MLEFQFLKAIKKHYTNVNFDLVVFATPPITFTNVVQYLKQKRGSKAYLILKDIFPQNAVDLGIIKKNGLFYKLFRKKEKKLYKTADYIGCMSPANVAYIIKHNPQLNPQIIEVNPNSIEPISNYISEQVRIAIRVKYSIPQTALLFIYGGNLGKPQGIDFLLEVIDSNKNKKDVYFLIFGSGTEYNKIQKFLNVVKPDNAKLYKSLPKNEYDNIVQASDVGLILLDKRFTIPNYPSRLLTYMEYKKPVLVATDSATDIGNIAEENGYGFKCLHGDISSFNKHIKTFVENREIIKTMGQKGYNYLMNNYTVKKSYDIIMNHFK